MNFTNSMLAGAPCMRFKHLRAMNKQDLFCFVMLLASKKRQTKSSSVKLAGTVHSCAVGIQNGHWS